MWSFGNIGVAKGRRAARSCERLLAVSINANEILVLEATRTGRAVTCLSSAKWSIPETLLGATGKPVLDHAAVGRWLRQKLDTQGIATRQSVLVLPRQTAMLKLIDVPDVARDELASLVLLQAESRLARPLEELCCDYLKLPDKPFVLLASVPRQTVESQTSILTEAGLDVLTATIGELNLTHHDPDSLIGGTQLSVAANQEQAELILSQAGIPMTAMTVRRTCDVDRDRRSLAAAVTRLIASLPSQFSISHIGSIALFGSHAAELVPNGACIEQPQAITLTENDLPDAQGMLVEPALAMSLASRASPNDSLDLLNPRQPTDPLAMNRRRMRRWGLAAAALIGIGAFFAYEHSRALTAEIAQLKRRDAELTKLIERGQALLGTAAFVEDWRQSQVDWPQEVSHFVEQLPARERAYLTRLTLDVVPDSAAPMLRASGLARETADVLQLHQQLLTEQAGYSLQPHAIEPNPHDALFKARFDIEATGLPRDRSPQN